MTEQKGHSFLRSSISECLKKSIDDYGPLRTHFHTDTQRQIYHKMDRLKDIEKQIHKIYILRLFGFFNWLLVKN